MTRRSDVLELAVLGLLQDGPLHGYELRKRLVILLGWGRALSYGTLYPSLKALTRKGWIAADVPSVPATPAAPAREGAGRAGGRGRSRISYRLTPEGRQRFAELLRRAGPAAWEDETFGVHFAFFGQTDASVRLRILEGRRSRLEERLEQFRVALQRRRERLDAYTAELQRHGLESAEREVRWLDQLIDHERHGGPGAPRRT